MWGHSAWLNAALLLGVAGCIDSASVQCEFGLCPPGSSCDETAKVCIPPGCGDGVVSGTEQCDGAVNAAFDCTSFGFYEQAGLTCSSACQLDTRGCAKTCGDFEINGPETCDGIPPVDQTCGDYGFQIGRLGCSVECAPSFAGCESIGWHRGIGNAPDDLHAVWGVGQGNMYAVGNAGAILHSTGGLWSPQTSGTTNNLLAIWGTGAHDIYAVGAAGTILHSTDGATWTAMTVPVTATLRAISGSITPAQIQIWVVGEQGTILTASYPPGGNAVWTQETSGTTAILRGVWAQNTQFVIAVGDAPTAGTASPTALRRELATPGWTPIVTPTIQPANPADPMKKVALNAVWGSNAGFVAAGDATFASGAPRSTVMQYNGTQFAYTGQSLGTRNLLSAWGVITPLPEDPTQTRTDIFLGGDGGTLLHYNGVPGPASFDQLELNTTLGVPGLWGTGPAFVRAAMYGGGLMDYDGTDLSAQAVVPGVQLSAVWHDPVANITIAGGDDGKIVRRDFSGWGAPTTIGSGSWTGILGFGTTVFACSVGNGIIQSTNSGTSWGAAALIGYNFHALWGLSPASVWAAGNNGHVAHFNGAAWTTPAVIATADLHGVWGTSDSDIFVVGSSGYIAHYDGATWTPMASGETVETINGVWGTASNDVFAAGDAGMILHYDGVAWRRMTSNTGANLGSIGGTGHGDVFIGGRNALFHYIGNSWAPMNVGIEDVYAIWAEKQDSYFAGTADIARLRRTELDVEARCGDPWDNDGDGLANCADSDCYAADEPLDVGCAAGGSCGPTTPMSCGYVTEPGTTSYTGLARIDDLPCLDHATPGPEASYRLIADRDGTIVVTLDDPGGQLDLVQLDPFDATRTGCDVGHCAAAPASGDRSVTVNAVTGGIYYFVVDGPEGVAEAFTLSVACP